MSKHVATCVDAQLCGEDGNDADKPRIETEWQIDEGEEAGNTYYKHLYLTDKAFKWSLKSLRNAGFEGDNLATVGEQLKGNKAVVVLEEDEWEGNVRTVIKWINKLGGGVPMQGEAKISFAEKMMNKIAALEAGKEEESEEVPFDV